MIHRWQHELVMRLIVPAIALLIFIWICHLVYTYLPIHLTLLDS